MKKAVVTGGAGFIGSHVVDALLTDGYEVLVIDDFSSGREANLSQAKSGAGSLTIEKCDICDSRIGEIFNSFKPEKVFHLAAQMDVRRSVREPIFDCEKNVLGTVNILDASKSSGARQVIFSSTGGAIYGEQEVFPADEDHRTRAESPYGISKRAGELYLEYFSRIYNMSCVSLRYANVYGPRQNPHGEAGVVAIFSERIIKGEALKVFGDGKQTRDFVFVADVVAANMLAAQSIGESGFVVLNVGRGVETNVLDLVDGLTKAWKKLEPEKAAAKEVAVEFAPARPGEQMRSVISPERISKSLGWSSSIDVELGLEKTLESFLAKQS